MMNTFLVAAAVVVGLGAFSAPAVSAEFGPQNPFYSPSTLPFQAPPFDKIKDSDYQPAIEAGMAQERKEMQAIANNPDAADLRQHHRRHGEDRASLLQRCYGRSLR